LSYFCRCNAIFERTWRSNACERYRGSISGYIAASADAMCTEPRENGCSSSVKKLPVSEVVKSFVVSTYCGLMPPVTVSSCVTASVGNPWTGSWYSAARPGEVFSSHGVTGVSRFQGFRSRFGGRIGVRSLHLWLRVGQLRL
jgi:hypothetical protein